MSTDNYDSWIVEKRRKRMFHYDGQERVIHWLGEVGMIVLGMGSGEGEVGDGRTFYCWLVGIGNS